MGCVRACRAAEATGAARRAAMPSGPTHCVGAATPYARCRCVGAATQMARTRRGARRCPVTTAATWAWRAVRRLRRPGACVARRAALAAPAAWAGAASAASAAWSSGRGLGTWAGAARAVPCRRRGHRSRVRPAVRASGSRCARPCVGSPRAGCAAPATRASPAWWATSHGAGARCVARSTRPTVPGMRDYGRWRDCAAAPAATCRCADSRPSTRASRLVRRSATRGRVGPLESAS